jgi:hypothetical protein
VGAVSPLVAEAAGDLWLRSADGVAAWRLLGVCLLFTEARLVRRAVQ